MVEPWQEILMYTVKNRKEKMAIYPFGKMGLRIKHFLNDVLGIREDLRIDSYYSQFTDYVHTVETLTEIDEYKKYIYIISTTIHNFAHELLIRGISEKNIIFCYPEYGVYSNTFNAYHGAVLSLIKKFNPTSILDADLLLCRGGGKKFIFRNRTARDIAGYNFHICG